MADRKFDVIVVGGGPGGYCAGIGAGREKLNTALIEKERIGGTCLNRGCIPSKALLASAHLYHHALEAAKMGITVGEVGFDIAQIHKRKAEIVDQNVTGVEHILKLKKVEVIPGTARLLPGKRVEVTHSDGQTEVIGADNLILAFGSEVARIPIPGLDGEGVWTSDDALAYEGIPESITIIGAGAIGLEFTDYFRTMGSQVTIIEMLDRALPIADPDISKELTRSLKKVKVPVHTSATVTKVDRVDGKLVVTFRKGDKEETVASEVVLVAAGRRPATRGVGLEEAGIAMERGAILVDDHMRTNVPGVYAIGDALGAGGMMLAHSAFKEAEVAVDNILGHDRVMDYSAIPSVVYTSPEVAWVGLTEPQAAERGPVRTGQYMFRANGRALAEGYWDGFAKTVADAETGRILGVHMIGGNSSELIAGAGVAVSLGMTAEEYVTKVTHPHPTMSEVLFEAIADSWGLAVHKP